MNEHRIESTSRYTTRAMIFVVAVYLALAVGAPWLLYESPPSAEAVVAAKVWGAKSTALPAPTPTRTSAPAR